MVHNFCLYLKFHSCVRGTRKTKHHTCRFSFVCFVCILSANITITPDPISVSEGQNFSIKCTSDVSNYDEVYWNTSAGIKIYQRFFTTRKYPDGAESVLTVTTSTREWNGEWKTSTLLCCLHPWIHSVIVAIHGGLVLRYACASHFTLNMSSYFMQQSFGGKRPLFSFTDVETEGERG